MKEKTLAVLFGGIGGFSAGAVRAKVEYGGQVYKYRLLVSIDCDSVACLNHDIITGEKTAVVMDLFSRKQYIAFHGQEPPAEWREVTPWDIWEAFGRQVPNTVFLSPPCKGLSGLLPEKSAKSMKYQALNELTVRGIELTLQACHIYGGHVPEIIHFENVPRITSRGKHLLSKIKALLKKYEYAVNMNKSHNLGEIGGLGQNRVRFLIMARQEQKVPNFIYTPPKKRLRAIGEVIGPLPLPGDTEACGWMHRIPNLMKKTWERLALIVAGGDWRNLNELDWENYRIIYVPRGGGAYGVQDWEQPAKTITGQARITGSNGCAAVADPRIGHVPRQGSYEVACWDEPCRTVTGSSSIGTSNGVQAIQDPRTGYKEGTHACIYQICKYDQVCPTVTGAVGPNNGCVSIADPRLNDRESRHPGVYRVVKMDEQAPCVTGTRFGSGALAVADPRLKGESRPNLYGVADWNEPGKTVTGSASVSSSNGVAAIADPRIPDRPGRYTDKYKVLDWDKESTTVTGVTDIQSGAKVIADPRLNCSPRSGSYGVQDWNKTGNLVTASADVHSGTAAVADPRIPSDNERGVFIYISVDGTWHRPLTTFELAMLQSFSRFLPDGRPFQLEGCSDAKAREYIGNAYPSDAAEATCNCSLMALAKADAKVEFELTNETIWVIPVEERDGERDLKYENSSEIPG